MRFRTFRPLIALAAAAALSPMLLPACSGGEGDRDGAQPSGSTVSGGGVTLTLPEGWSFLDDDERGLVVAERRADLTAAMPEGPRLTVAPGSTVPPEPEALVNAIVGTDPNTPRVDVVLEPEIASVGPEEGVVIDLREEEAGSAVVRRYFFVNVDGVNVYQFVLETPEEIWEFEKHGLGTIAASAEFEIS